MKFQYYFQEPDLIVKNIDIQTVSRPKSYRHSFRNGRTKHGFIYIVSGAMEDVFSTEGKKSLICRAGELIFIPKGSIYTGIYLEENTKIKIIQFDLESGVLPEYMNTPVKIQLPNAGELIEAFFQPVERHLFHHPFYYFSCLYRLLWEIDKNDTSLPKKYKRLQAALSEMVTYFDQNKAISYYAALCDMSEVNFRRLFREYIGMSPIDYRNELRLNNARALLKSGEYNVSEAA